MIWFSQRQRLVNCFENWCRNEGLVQSATNLVAFLMLNGLLDEDKTLEFLNGGIK